MFYAYEKLGNVPYTFFFHYVLQSNSSWVSISLMITIKNVVVIINKYFLCPKIKGASILCDTFDPDAKVYNDLYIIFPIAPGV